ncbi:MAG: pyruvate carboxylase subunit B, partial [Clostridia bacterium]|nr:pyruvate carboxylase subunit B [Clostridia bacterium]
AISYTISPVHTNETFINMAKELEGMGASSICIKDMAGLLTPYNAYDLVKGMKEAVSIPIELHTHYTSGIASMTYLKAIEAGVDIVDCAMSPFAMGTSQPATEPLVATLEGTQYDTGLDLNLLSEIADYFRPIRERYLESGTLNPKALAVDVNTLKYQVPGGMLSNLLSQLKQLGAEDKFQEVLKEIPRVREDAGYPPLVTPTSQIVGSQAVFNVVLGERYKNVTKEFRGLVKGEYGRTPVEISDEFAKKILGDEPRITGRPADDIPNELDKFRSEIGEYIEQDEDVLSYALFGPVATKYFEFRQGEKYKLDMTLGDKENMVHPM